MKFNAIEQFEVVAEAFRTMTGHMRPGKDASPFSYPAPREEREAAFKAWRDQNQECVRAMLIATERTIRRDEDGDTQ